MGYDQAGARDRYIDRWLHEMPLQIMLELCFVPYRGYDLRHERRLDVIAAESIAALALRDSYLPPPLPRRIA